MQSLYILEPSEYMAFGLSKDDSKSNMIGADAVVAYFDDKQKGHAVDYYLSSKEQVKCNLFKIFIVLFLTI